MSLLWLSLWKSEETFFSEVLKLLGIAEVNVFGNEVILQMRFNCTNLRAEEIIYFFVLQANVYKYAEAGKTFTEKIKHVLSKSPISRS